MASIVQPLSSTVRIVEWDELPARVRATLVAGQVAYEAARAAA